MLKTCGFHNFIQRPHFSQNAKNLFRASFLTPSDIAAYLMIVVDANFNQWLEYSQPQTAGEQFSKNYRDNRVINLNWEKI